MWKSTATKAIIGALGAGTVATGAVFVFKPSGEENNYENHLKKQGRGLLTQDSEHWTSLISKYSSEGSDLLITIGEQQKSTLQAEELKGWCSQNSKKPFTDTKDATYQRVSAWCTKPKKIEDLIGEGRVALNDADPSGTVDNNSEWTEKVNKYKDEQNKDLIKEITDGNQEGQDVAAANFNDANKLRKWCRFSKVKYFKYEEDPRFLKYLKWCTK